MSKFLSSILIILFFSLQSELVVGEGYLEFTGTVLNDAKPVAGATATLFLTGLTGAEVSTVRTGANGKFSFDVAYGKMYRIVVKKTGYTQMVLLINGFVPGSEKGFIMSYGISFDIFKHRKGFETKMANNPLIKIAYIHRKENFGSSKRYTNSATYIPIPEDEKPVTVKEKIETETKEEVKVTKSDEKIEVEPEPVTAEEEQFIKDTKEQSKNAELKGEIAESAASESRPEEIAVKQQEKSLEQIRARELKASRLRESLIREREQARREVAKNRSARSNAQQNLMKEIADMMRDEKQNNK